MASQENPWTTFWKQGHSTTFGGFMPSGYVGEVKDWWVNQLSEAGATPRVLEIGCGSGSLLPAMAPAVDGGEYVGVDFAEVKLSEVAVSASESNSSLEVSLLSGVDAASLPDQLSGFDLAASVFGIEYSDLAKSLLEVRRVLKSGGRFVALMHHAGSVVTETSEKAVGEHVEEDIDKGIDAIESISRSIDLHQGDLSKLKSDEDAEVAREGVNGLAQKYLSTANQAGANPVMFEFMTGVLDFFKMLRQPAGMRGAYIEKLRIEFADSKRRYQQMVSVAKTEEQMKEISILANAAGFNDVVIEPFLIKESEVYAWYFSAR